MKASLKAVGRGLGLLLAAVLLCAGAVSAQQTAGTLRGQVSDEFGGVIVGATVTVTDSGGKSKDAVTGSDGAFSVAGLMPGRHSVRVYATGFSPYESADVDIKSGRNELPAITLGVSLEKEEVTVASEGPLSVDTASAGAIVLKGKDLESLPEDPDELAAALAALAGPAAGPNGGQITIDGFEGGRIPSRDSIREVRINDNPLSAENDRPGFGGITILTKPGTEKLRGSFGMTFNDESMNSRNPFLKQEKRPPFQFRQFNGNLSGTIVPKKSSFFIDFNRGETDDNDLVNGFVLDPETPLGVRVPFNLAVLTPRRNWSISPRVDYSLNDNHTLVARYNFFRNEDLNQGVSQYSLPERAFDQTFSSHNIQLTETAVVNKTTVNETRFQFIRNRSEQDALTDGLAINVFDAFSRGGATVGDSFNESTRWEVTNTTTQARGAHSLKFGARLRGIRLSDFSENNFNGTFTFSSLDEYRAALAGQDTATQFSVSGGEPLAEISQVDFGGFFQDDWKLRPNLTVGYGLRYERQTNIKSNLNFAPRVYLAWSPDGGAQRQAKTVIRLGFGLFYDRIGENFALQSLRYNGINQQQFIVTEPLTDAEIKNLPISAEQQEAELQRAQLARTILSRFNDDQPPTAAELSAFSVSQTTRRMAADATAPYSYITGLIVTRQLTKTSTLNVFFSTYDTRHVLRQRNVNAPLDGVRPQPGVGNIFQFETSGTQSMRQLNISVSKQFMPGVSLTANYTLGKAQSDTDFGGFPVNQYDLSGEYGRTSFDTRHRFILFASLGIPKLKLSLNPMVIANTGRPFNIITGTDNNRDGIINDRPAFATAATRPCSGNQRLGIDCDLVQSQWGDFDVNPKAGQTVIPRNFGEGPGFVAVNLRIGRAFAFGDTPASRAAAERSRQQQEQQRQQRGQQGGAGRGGGDRTTAGGPGGGGPRGGGGGGGPMPGMGGGPMMIMMGAPGGGGGEGKRYTLNFSLNFINLLNHTNFGQPVGNLRSPDFGRSLFSVGGFGGGGGNQAAGNRRVQASVRFSF
ncbi:MAG TPA: carboxypeptidase regulatory-like domain-containing protein [Pyrinomonadaceae bacterium]|jgi:hypothetical protein